MTLANQITLIRILLIPVFVLFAIYYAQSLDAGTPEEWLRLTAIAVFLIAAVTDGLDGWVARRFNQRSRLGAILDPIADKGLLLAAIITLSIRPWAYGFPLWFPVVVIARDVIIVSGYLIIHHLDVRFDVKPSLIGKAATVSQMAAVGWVMLTLPHPIVVVWIAGALTLASGAGYVIRGVNRLREHEHSRAAP